MVSCAKARLKRYIWLASDNRETTLEATDTPSEVSAAVLQIQNSFKENGRHISLKTDFLAWFLNRETQGGARPLVPTHSVSQAVLALTLTTKQPAITPH